MPIVNRLLDVFFRTLDVVDAARERVDRALGRQVRPEPWTTQWSPVPEPPVSTVSAPSITVPTPKAPAPTTTPKPAAKSARSGGGGKKKKAAPIKSTGKRGGTNRKGSVDKRGADLDSPRAKAIFEKMKAQPTMVIAEEATHEGKKVLARVLWALNAADKAGSELGLTAVDASALLHLAAGVEVFATNVARTCRDETELIVESAPDGRSKRYKLTDAGREAAAKLDVRPLA